MTTATGVYCRKCGYDLRASTESKRCPECGRPFSPDNPRTFRTRPPAGLWEKALRYSAVPLLALLLLGGTWTWFYWGWKQEQAVVAALHANGGTDIPTEWERQVARWAGRAGFVVQRVNLLLLPLSATDADLVQLRRLPHVKVLYLAGTKVTDAGLVHVRDLRELRTLNLWHLPITDAGLVHVEELPRLTWLHLDATRVTDAGMARVAKLTTLQTLWLAGTAVTDAGLVPLEKLPNLEYLNVEGTRVTPAGIARLKAALPRCTIVGP